MPLDISAASDMGVEIEGYQPRAGEEVPAYYNRVGPRYFETLGIPIVRGRAIDANDVDGKAAVGRHQRNHGEAVLGGT